MLLLNVGNTHTQFARRTDSGEIILLHTSPSNQLDASSLRMRQGNERVAVASVVPRVRELWGTDDVFYLDCHAQLGLASSQVDMSSVGADRLANVCEGLSRGDAPFLVLDCGTAITGEWVDCARCFRGGFIAPGRKLMRHALHDHTAQLPLLDISETIPFEGNNTRNAMRIGIDAGAIGLLKELTNRIRELAEDTLRCYLVGGDASFFARHLPDAEFGGADFTLRGLAHACDLSGKES